jgi:hypothetical protein
MDLGLRGEAAAQHFLASTTATMAGPAGLGSVRFLGPANSPAPVLDELLDGLTLADVFPPALYALARASLAKRSGRADPQ